MAAKQVVTGAEVSLAQKFLRLVHADTSNYYLVDAVIAWLRYNESKGHITGNNPFGLYAAGVTHYKDRGAESTSYARLTFSSLSAGLDAAAYALLHNKQFASVEAALHRQEGTDSEKAAQAQDFFVGLAQAQWDPTDTMNQPVSGELGYTQKAASGRQYVVWTNKLFELYDTLLGHPITISPAKTTTSKPHRAPAMPQQLPSTFNTIDRPNYIQPYASMYFYDDRHKEPTALPPV